MHKRMEDVLHEAEAIADIMAPGVNPASVQGRLHSHTSSSLCSCIVQLDCSIQLASHQLLECKAVASTFSGIDEIKQPQRWWCNSTYRDGQTPYVQECQL